jgi:hypothetical protein
MVFEDFIKLIKYFKPAFEGAMQGWVFGLMMKVLDLCHCLQMKDL